MDETTQIQKAIEDIADSETGNLPELPHIEDVITEEEGGQPETGTPPEEKPEGTDEIGETEDGKAKKKKKKKEKAPKPRPKYGTTWQWFFTFMCMNIPLIGWFYLFYLAFGKKYPERKSFARAYMLYKLLILVVSLAILGALAYFVMGLVDQLLAYMEML